jgi:hypothetical protein
MICTYKKGGENPNAIICFIVEITGKDVLQLFEGENTKLLCLFSDAVSRLLPSLDTASQDPDIRKPFIFVFHCPTGSARFLRSGAVKDDCLLFRERGEAGQEFLERKTVLQLHFPELCFVVVRAHENCLARSCFLMR